MVEKADQVVGAKTISKRVVVVYECLFSEASNVLAGILLDTRYRRHWCSFIGRWPADETKPMVQIEVEYAVTI